MQVIQHQELASAQSSIVFNSIPQTFTDLFLVCSLRGNSGAVFGIHYLRFNGSTSGYSGRYLEGSGSSAYSGTYTFGAYLGASTGSSATANTFSNLSAYIPNYTSSSSKSVSLDGVGENNGTQAFQDINAALWTGTDPITSITILNDSSQNLLQYSSATLYGVLKGSDGVTTVS
jgi:hypothetical protein